MALRSRTRPIQVVTQNETVRAYYNCAPSRPDTTIVFFLKLPFRSQIIDFIKRSMFRNKHTCVIIKAFCGGIYVQLEWSTYEDI